MFHSFTIKNVVSHGIRLHRPVRYGFFLKLSRQVRLMFSKLNDNAVSTMKSHSWRADINSILFRNVYSSQFLRLRIVYYPRKLPMKTFFGTGWELRLAFSRIFPGEISRSGHIYSRIRESDSAES